MSNQHLNLPTSAKDVHPMHPLPPARQDKAEEATLPDMLEHSVNCLDSIASSLRALAIMKFAETKNHFCVEDDGSERNMDNQIRELLDL